MHKALLTILGLAILLTASCQPDQGQASPAVRALEVPVVIGARLPHFSTTPAGTLILSWLHPTETGVSLQWAELDSGRWKTGAEVARGDDWFVNWADFPSVTPIDQDTWAAHWLVRKPGGAYAYDVVAAFSRDRGQSWGEPFVVHDDDSATEHGFVTLFPWQGDTHVLWLDGRNTKPGASHHSGGMTLRSARFDRDDPAVERVEIDALVCDCCQTDVAVSAAGPVAVYRNRSNSEVRDIHVTRYVDGQWQADRPVADDGWIIAGCPVNGPAIDAAGRDVAVAWFTAANDDLRIRFARSADDGETFGDAIDIDSGKPFGRVDVVQLADGASLVSWIRESLDGQAELVVRVVSADAALGPVMKIADLTSGRISGFPQMQVSGNDLVFAWTDSDNGTTILQSAAVAVDDLYSM
ncbi:MAG: sialidase family protein [Pseudomonadota bacterium]